MFLHWVGKGKVANQGSALKSENAKSQRIQQQLRAKYRSKDEEVRKSLKSVKREWLNSLMDDAQHAADKANTKTLYGITKTLCNEGTPKNTAINDKGGKTITDDSSGLLDGKNILKRSSTDHHRQT